MQIKFKNFINEKLMIVEEDVDYIYNTFFKKDIDEIYKTGIITTDMFKKNEFDTSKLKSKLSIQANIINPCKILINYSSKLSNNTYNFKEKIISFGIHDNAVRFILKYGKGDIKIAANQLEDIIYQKTLIQEFTEQKIRGSINHELAHWIDDSLNNNNIEKYMVKYGKIPSYKQTPITLSKIEIEGLIHNIYQTFLKNKDIWDTLSFYDLTKMIPLLHSIQNGLSNKNRKIWKRKIKTRMHREKILGKNMV